MDGRTLLPVALCSLAAAAVALQSGPGGSASNLGSRLRVEPRPDAEYRTIDNVVGARVELNIPAVRPLALAPGTDTIYAVNTHDSTIESFDATSGAALDVFPVPWGPTAVVYRARDPQPDELLVVCRGSYAFLRLDAATGEPLALIELVDGAGRVQAEPGDLLLDEAGQRAFVSCAASDSVVQLDLATNTVQRVYSERHGDAALRLKNPLFLSFDAAGRVLVAPLSSGNGTLSEPDEGEDDVPGIVVDTTDWFEPLPDEDLFRIDPDAGTVEVVARRTGAVLFAHGTNPATGRLWQLATRAHNADPSMQTEATARGRFATNQLSITQPGVPPPTSHVEVDLDALAAGNPDRILAQPYALAFLEQGAAAGVGLVAGLLSDTVVAIGPSGSTIVGAWRLEDGSIPRGILVSEDETQAFAHCWGTNRVARIDLTVPGSTPAYFDLRHDPTPADMRRGRELFYDAHNSADSNLACATCHVEGRSDMLVWNLSDNPGDDKGPMVTQPLVKLDRIGRLHWRGERELRSFNKAFDSLLGGVPLDATPGGDVEHLEEFLRSIQNPANPNESKHRLLDDGERPPGLQSADVSARRGQEHFFETKVFRASLGTDGGYTCSECHNLPVGAMGDTFVLKWANFPRRGQRKIPPLVGLWRKAQSSVVARAAATDPAKEYAFLGPGMTHNGRVRDLRAFIGGVGVADSVQVEDDLAAFVHQLDEGLAPAVHRALLLGPGTVGDGVTAAEIEGYLLDRARRRDCDVVAFGSVDLGSGPVAARWVYERTTGTFQPDSSALAPRPFSFFVDQAQDEGRSQVFVGLPYGMGQRFGIDYDLDGKPNRDEPGMEYVPDPVGESVPPEFVVQPTVQWVTAREARLSWETDEPTTYQLIYGEPGSPNRVVTGEHFSRAHAGLIVQLRPSPAVDPTNPTGPPAPPATYDVTVRAIDRNGNTRSVAVPGGVTTRPFLRDKVFESLEPGGPLVEDLETEQGLVLGGLEWLVADDTSVPGTLLARVRAKVVYQAGTPLLPAPRRTVVASVLVWRGGTRPAEASTDFVPGIGAGRFDSVLAVTGSDTAYLTPSAQPLLVTLESDDQGIIEFEFRQPGLAPGDRVVLNVESVAAVDPGGLALFHDNLANQVGVLEVPVVSQRYAWTRWSFPDSKVRIHTCFQASCE